MIFVIFDRIVRHGDDMWIMVGNMYRSRVGLHGKRDYFDISRRQYQ